VAEDIGSPAQALTSAEALYALLQVPKIGHQLALAAAVRRGGIPRVRDVLADRSRWARLKSQSRRLIDSYARRGIVTIGFFDPLYPALLRSLDDPPALLWVRGDPGALAARSVAVVGTREPTDFGLSSAEMTSRAAARSAWTVVSGLAKGIDTAAHRAVLDAGGSTVAVLAGGLDRVYPAENRDLAEQVADHGGALVSEHPPGSHPGRGAFVARDRIQSGLSRAVFICQTGRSGGALHTARFGVLQGRPIYCPYPPDASGSSEGLRLLVERPGRELARLLPQWADDVRLRGHLLGSPIARPYDPSDDGLGRAFAELEEMESSSPREERRPDQIPVRDAETVEQLSMLSEVGS
jgi:DNA processing protein